MGSIHTYWYKHRNIEKKLRKFLSLYLENIHSANVSDFAEVWFNKEDNKAMKEFCLEQGYIKNESITHNGIILLDMIEKRRLTRLQLYFNIVLTIATVLTAFISIMSVIR